MSEKGNNEALADAKWDDRTTVFIGDGDVRRVRQHECNKALQRI
jgi:hypothetical protein